MRWSVRASNWVTSSSRPDTTTLHPVRSWRSISSISKHAGARSGGSQLGALVGAEDDRFAVEDVVDREDGGPTAGDDGEAADLFVGEQVQAAVSVDPLDTGARVHAALHRLAPSSSRTPGPTRRPEMISVEMAMTRPLPPGAQRGRGADRKAASSPGSVTSRVTPVTTTLQPEWYSGSNVVDLEGDDCIPGGGVELAAGTGAHEDPLSFEQEVDRENGGQRPGGQPDAPERRGRPRAAGTRRGRGPPARCGRSPCSR